MKRMTSLMVLFVFILSWTLPVAAIDIKSAQKDKSTIDNRINKINQDKKKVLEQKAKLESAKKAVTKTQAAESNAYKQLVNEVADLEAYLKELEQAVAQAEDNYNQQRELLKTRLKVMYENSNTSVLETLLKSENLIDFLAKLQYMSLISMNDQKIVDELNQAKMDVEYKKKLQEDTRQQLLGKVSDKQQRLSSLKASRADLESQISRSQAELKKLEKEEDALVAESNRLNSVIKNLSKKGKYAGGSMIWPCPGNFTVVSSFGMRKHPILRKYKMHTGIDIDADKGDSIVAANKGTVIISKYDRNGYGNMVVIDHGGGITTLYGHASKLLVKVGDEVRAGQVIAKVGSTGLSTGPHLHFEVRKDGIPKNPLVGYLSK